MLPLTLDGLHTTARKVDPSTLSTLLIGLPCTKNIQASFEELLKYRLFTV